MLVSQVARVHSVVWEKAMDVLDNMNGMKQAAGSDAQAVDAARVGLRKRLIGQGELVDKQPGMAAALFWHCTSRGVDDLRGAVD